ncbi:flagellar FlbD family protein [Lentibacillus sp. CBA3610]|uniref:flagellar FlbD family protein n=1 Tax=Lentibacillus sp. CBA3610 TaxID=2518176 RepID=UPI0015956E6F|nr:flagellar FlbD family protein [Lentibacillus sp. CBA3610]QKY69039.1 flagellar protein FlbD [Lentibacillus sp. CBA3610]
MIQLTKLNGDLFTLNALMIEQVQSYPDTTITLTNGKKIVVKDSKSDVAKLVTDYYKQIGLSSGFKEAGDRNG